MSLRCWTPGPTAGTVLATWLLLMARNGCSDTEGDKQLWAMHPTCRYSCQSPSAAHKFYCTIRVATCWLYQHWDNDGVGSTPKYGEHFGLFWPLHETHYGIYDPQPNCKTVAKFLWQGYISIFRALAKFLSDWGASFDSNIIRQLCELMGIQKVRTSPYHAQTNGQVEWAHQMLMCVRGKLGSN